MFAGIIEEVGIVTKIDSDKTNVHFTISCNFYNDLYIDQSIAHNGVCLTVINIVGNEYTVTAVQETLDRSNLGLLKLGDKVNLERCILPTTRIDGHYVQGHVDTVGRCEHIENANGSWYFTFSYNQGYENLLVDKGSISVNGVSLTLVDPVDNNFQVAIIPYTYEHTNFGSLKVGDQVNLEFDILGKYVARNMGILISKTQIS